LPWLRLDASAERRFETLAYGTARRDGELPIESTIGLVSFYVDTPLGADLVPYVGAGARWTENSVEGGRIGPRYFPAPLVGRVEEGAAYAAMAGFGYPIGEGLVLDLGWRRIWLGEAGAGKLINRNGNYVDSDPTLDELVSNDIRVGLRWEWP
jgi:opacity protein-like surface antigen